MQPKFDWVTLIISGVVLAILSVPVHAYTMSFIFKYIETDTYFVWAISSAAPAFLFVFPMGLLAFKARPFFYGGLTGVVAVVGLVLLNAALGIYPSTAFVIEYISLILFSGLAAYLGRLIRLRMKKTGPTNI